MVVEAAKSATLTNPAYIVLVRSTLYTFQANTLHWQFKIPYPHAKIRFLFCTEHPSVRARIQYDNVSLYSVTDQSTAHRIALFCRSLAGITSASTITDGTACIGGNTIAFARAFARVHAVEYDEPRYQMLRHNVNLLLDTDTVNRVRVRCGDYTEVFSQLSQDLVFLDPPWGGKAYKHQSAVDLTLGEWPLSRLCQELRGRCSHVVIKVPTNFNVRGLSRGIRESVRVVRIAGKVMLVVVCWGG